MKNKIEKIYIPKFLQNRLDIDLTKTRGILDLEQSFLEIIDCNETIPILKVNKECTEYYFFLCKNNNTKISYKLYGFKCGDSIVPSYNENVYIANKKILLQNAKKLGEPDIETFLSLVDINDNILNKFNEFLWIDKIKIDLGMGKDEFLIKHIAYSLYLTLKRTSLEFQENDLCLTKEQLEYQCESLSDTYFTHYNDFIIMHSALYHKGDDVYVIFKKGENKLKLFDLQSSKKSFFDENHIIKNIKKLPNLYLPFENLSDVLFQYDKLALEGIEKKRHILLEHPERKQELLKELKIEYRTKQENEKEILDLNESDSDKYKEKLVELIKIAGKKTITNYRYAYPYVYIDNNGDYNSFLLPIGYNLVAVIKKSNNVIKKNKKKRNQDEISYSIPTLLTTKMAISQLRHFHPVGNDWVTLEVVNKKLNEIRCQ